MTALERALTAPAPRRIVEVVALMDTVEGALPAGDGVAAFTHLYRAVTIGVDGTVDPQTFHDGRFIRWLDVVFANLYFRALRASFLGRGLVPKAWAPLLEARERHGVLPLQYALAGMSAHINFDLPVALVETWKALDVEPSRDSPQYEDFTRVNGLLEQTEEEVKRWFLTGIAGVADEALGRLDDVIGMWSVSRAREAAWVNGETLWELRRVPALAARYLTTLDRMVGYAGRGLLRPVF